MVARLNVNGAVDIREMSPAAKRLRERSKASVKVRSRGHVHVKLGTVTRGSLAKHKP
jgi:hypothetical protein